MSGARQHLKPGGNSIGSVLLKAAAINSRNQHVKAIFLDISWRSIWLAGVCGLLAVLGLALMSHLSSFQLEGPDLGGPSPIILLAALQTFWRVFGSTVVLESFLAVLLSVCSWLLLEALFRGGRQAFWIYLGTAIARVSTLGAAAVLFSLLAIRDESAGMWFLGGSITLALVFVLALLESVVRRDALDLLAVDLIGVAGLVGILLSVEGLLGLVLWGGVAVALLMASGGAEVMLALTVFAAATMVWMVVHSYLIAVRYAAIDIMRKHVVG